MRLNLLIFQLCSTLFIKSNEDVLKMSEDKNMKIFGSSNPGIFFFRNRIVDSHLDNEFRKAFSTFENKINLEFVMLDINEEIERPIARMLFIRPRDLPIIKIVDTRFDDVKTFVMTGEINSESILNFIKKTFEIKSFRNDL